MFLFILGFFIFGPQMMIGIACAELAHKKAAATATGFAGFFAYCLGAVFAGAPLGAIVKNWGWDSYLLTLEVCCLFPALLMLPLWSIKTYRRDDDIDSSWQIEAAQKARGAVNKRTIRVV